MTGSPFKDPVGFGQCIHCKKRPAKDEKGLCRPCHHVATYRPDEVTAAQIGRAARTLRHDSRMMRWPYAAMDAMTGPVPVGHVVYVAAGSGVGKTTFLYATVHEWLKQGIGVTVLPLETRADEWRQGLACTMAGYPAGDSWEMIGQARAGDLEAQAKLIKIEEQLFAQNEMEFLKNFQVVQDETVTVEGLDKAMALARSLGHLIVAVDHVDHIEADRDEVTGRKSNTMEASIEVNNALLKLAKMHNLVVVAMSQNKTQSLGDGDNRLLRYRPPTLNDLAYPGKKIQNAAQIVGIFRPLKAGIDRQTMQEAREGIIEPSHALKEGRMGIVALKLRHRGKNEGMQIDLAYEHGRLRDVTAHEIQVDQIMARDAIRVSHTGQLPDRVRLPKVDVKSAHQKETRYGKDD